MKALRLNGLMGTQLCTFRGKRHNNSMISHWQFRPKTCASRALTRHPTRASLVPLRLGLRTGQGHLMVHDIATIHFVRNRMKLDRPGISGGSALMITPSQPV